MPGTSRPGGNRVIRGIGPRVRELRIARRLSQVELARAVGIDASTLCHLEQDQANPSIPLLEDLARALRVPVRKILPDAWFVVDERAPGAVEGACGAV